MAGLGIVIPRNGPGTGPTPLHSNGVDNTAHRYIPGRVPNIGDAMATLPDMAGTVDLNAASPMPYLVTAGNAKALRWRDVDRAAMVSGGAGVPGAAFTFQVVAQSTSTGSNVFVLGGYRLQRASNGTWALAAAQAGGVTAGVVTGASTDGYVVLGGICDGANSRLFVNGVLSAGAGTVAAPLTAFINSFTLGGPAKAGDAIVIDVLEANIWNRRLSQSEITSNYEAMRSAFDVLA